MEYGCLNANIKNKTPYALKQKVTPFNTEHYYVVMSEVNELKRMIHKIKMLYIYINNMQKYFQNCKMANLIS